MYIDEPKHSEQLPNKMWLFQNKSSNQALILQGL